MDPISIPRPETISESLWEANQAVERSALVSGAERFRKHLDTGADMWTPAGVAKEASSAVHSPLMAKMVPPLLEALEAWLKEARSGKAGRKHALLPLLEGFKDLRVVCYYVAQAAASEMVFNKRSFGNLCVVVGERLQTEMQMAAFAELEGDYLKTALRRGVKTGKGYADLRAGLLKAANHKLNLNLPTWPLKIRTQLGAFLLHMLCDASAVCEVRNETHGAEASSKASSRLHTKTSLKPTPETYSWINNRLDFLADINPDYLPMRCPPKPWDSPYDGGYWLIPTTLVKSNLSGYHTELETKDLSRVYKALNGLQDTPWMVNEIVLGVARVLKDYDGLPETVIPSMEKPQWPSRPAEDATDAEKKAYAISVGQIITRNNENKGRRLQLLYVLKVAADCVGSPIWFPHTLDFRGRVYALPSGLTPQGDDFSKGLLQFATGKSIETQEQADCLAIHGANCWGLDKKPYAERLRWVADNKALIECVASDPLTNRQWMDADSPWCFLAWCLDWAGFLLEGMGYESHLAVAVDGTCSGLQHYSAILRDEIGGAAVNLTPGDRPADIYAVVAEKTIERVKAILDADSNHTLAAEWLKVGINRSCTKRPVMTLPYGVTPYAAREYIEDWVDEKSDHGRKQVFSVTPFLASKFLIDHLWSAIEGTVVKSREAMGWLHEVARITAREGSPIWWTTPVGFPVCQSYPNTRKTDVNTWMGKKHLTIRVREETGSLDIVKMANGVAPNFVHSMDASALMLTVNACLDEGIDHFAMIHDSYGCHAADMPRMNRILREQFVSMYETHDVMKEFKDEVTDLLPHGTELPPIPTRGTLDLQGVLSSPYFFS